MSLFDSRVWFSSGAQTSEDFDSNSLVISNIDNAPDKAEKIVTGSLQGVLRIYRPRKGGDVTSLLLETRLGSPILQVAAGRFVPGSNNTSLCILHPQRLVVYSVSSSGAQSSSDSKSNDTSDLSATAGGYLRLKVQFEHLFGAAVAGPNRGDSKSRFTAFNMTCGSFGGSSKSSIFSGTPSVVGALSSQSAVSSNHDKIAVQSLDGQVMMFDGTSAISPAHQLEGVLLPGPIVYSPRTDSIIVSTSDLRVASYKISSLSSGSLSGSSGSQLVTPINNVASGALATPSSSVSSNSNVKPEWAVNLGESASSMHIGRYHADTISAAIMASSASVIAAGGANAVNAPLDVVLIGDRTLFTLRDCGPVLSGNGSSSSSTALMGGQQRPIRSQSRLEHAVIASCLFSRSGSMSSQTTSILDPTHPAHNLLIATASKQLLVYHEEKLVWASKLPFAPTAIGVGSFDGTAGLLSLLSDKGEISVCYLGSDPPTGNLVGGSSSSELENNMGDVSSMTAELKKVQAKIRDAQSKKEAEPTDKLLIKATIKSVLEETPKNGHSSISGCGVIDGGRGYWWGPEDVQFEPDSFDDEEEDEEVQGGTDGDLEDVNGLRNNKKASTRGNRREPPYWVATARVTVAWSGPSPARSVQLTVSTPPWVRLPLNMRTFTIPEVGGEASGVPAAQIILPLRAAHLQSRNSVTTTSDFSVHFAVMSQLSREDGAITVTSDLRSATATLQCPISLLCRVCPPIKKIPPYKVTIDSNRPPASLASLFPDLLKPPPHIVSNEILTRVSTGASTVLSVLFDSTTGEENSPAGGEPVEGVDNATILVSKTGSGRYRIQASSPSALALVISTFIDRMTRFYAPGGAGSNALLFNDGSKNENPDPSFSKPFLLSISDPVTVDGAVEAIEKHLAARRELLAATTALEYRALEVRLVTKRILVRFKDKTPSPLNRLDMIAEISHENVLKAGRDLQRKQRALSQAGDEVTGHLLLLMTLLVVKHSEQLGEKGEKLIRSSLGLIPGVSSWDLNAGPDMPGWEECTEAALASLLKGGGGGGGGAQSSALQGSSSINSSSGKVPDDATKLKRYLLVLVDRLSKGGSV